MLPPPPAILAPSDPAIASLQAWVGPSLDPAPFASFAKARRRDLRAASQEPHRTWLLELLRNPSVSLRDWAATRLVEGGATASANGPFLDACADHFKRFVIRGNNEREHELLKAENPPEAWQDLGAIAQVHPDAPCWSLWRAQLRTLTRPAVTLGLYALFAPRLEAQDEPWVLAALTAAAAKPIEEPWQSLSFLLATDWLLLYGQDRHWQAFQAACTTKAWAKTLGKLEKDARSYPLFWIEAQGVRVTPAYTRPGPGAYTPPALHRTTFLQPEYPHRASVLQFSTDTHVCVHLDEHGRAIGLSLLPGYALGLFGPAALSWVGRWTFDPAKLDGTPVPDLFPATVRYFFKH